VFVAVFKVVKTKNYIFFTNLLNTSKKRINFEKRYQLMAEEEENQINIELSEEMAEGVYANLAMIAHSNSEFVIDFIRLMPGVPKAKVKARVVLTPEHAHRLLLALQDNIRKYEENFGEIRVVEDPVPFPMNFGGPIGEA
jgi:hypothetical protein